MIEGWSSVYKICFCDALFWRKSKMSNRWTLSPKKLEIENLKIKNSFDIILIDCFHLFVFSTAHPKLFRQY